LPFLVNLDAGDISSLCMSSSPAKETGGHEAVNDNRWMRYDEKMKMQMQMQI
jgi:hypothetical protein